jgi:hypothetical protein
MLRAAIVGVVIGMYAFAPTAPSSPAAPKRAYSCDAVRKREANLVKRLAEAEKRIAELEAQRDAELRRLQEEQRKLRTQLK